MNDFSSKSLTQRYNGGWANEAEGHFMRVHEDLPSPPLRFGLDRPSLRWGVQNLPKFVSHSPYYSMPKAFVEVQGFGPKGILLKLGKLVELAKWDATHPVWFWLWSRPKEEGLWMPLDAAFELWDRQSGRIERLDTNNDTLRGKAALRVTSTRLPWGVYDAPI